MTITSSIRAQTPRSPLRAYGLEARNELLRLVRTPAFVVPTLVFAPMFYVLFGIVLNRSTPGSAFQAAHYLLATYGVFGVMAPGLFGFGVSVALDRERGWLTFRRVLPVSPLAYLVAKMVMAMIFATLIFAILALLAITLGGVRLDPVTWLALGTTLMLGVLPFCAIGLFIGSRFNGESAPGLINLIYLPMAFLSGLWIPITALPAILGTLAPIWPSYHLAQIALQAIGQPYRGSALVHGLVLAGFTVVFLALALRRLRHAER